MKELAVITTYYNPCRYRTRRAHFDTFSAHMKASGVRLLTVECVFDNEAPELPASKDVIHLRADSLLWQKERLLNLAVTYLPASVDAVAWIDADVLFENPNWVRDTLAALDAAPIVQLFETCLRQTREGTAGDKPDVVMSMASVMQSHRLALRVQRYDVHGHTGYAWAMRRSIFDAVGLYEHAISGSADHFMAHAIFNDCGFCIQNALKHDPVQINHFKAWAARFYPHVQGQLGVVSGQIRHLWHGDLKHRNYFARMHQITDLGYNPNTDIVTQAGQPLSWAPQMNKPALIAYFHSFFGSRLEDGESPLQPTRQEV